MGWATEYLRTKTAGMFRGEEGEKPRSWWPAIGAGAAALGAGALGAYGATHMGHHGMDLSGATGHESLGIHQDPGVMSGLQDQMNLGTIPNPINTIAGGIQSAGDAFGRLTAPPAGVGEEPWTGADPSSMEGEDLASTWATMRH